MDDILVMGNDVTLVKKFTEKLNTVFSLKDLGDLHCFLQLKVSRSNRGIFLIRRGTL